MAEDVPDPWRSVVEISGDADAERAAHPELAARLDAAASPFQSSGTGVSGLLDDVDRRANIDIDAPLDSSRPGVAPLKGMVRKAGAFVARHLAQQTTVLVGGLSAAVRELDQRLHHLEQDGHASVVARVPDVRPRVATVLGSLEQRSTAFGATSGAEPSWTRSHELMPRLWSAFDSSTSGRSSARLDVLNRLVAAVAPGGWVAVVSVAPESWAEVADPVVRDLGGVGPLHPATWSQLLEERGGVDVQVHEGTGVNVIAAHW